MLFTDVRFAVLVAGCWLSFVSVPARFRSAVLATWGAMFYLLYAPASAPLVFGVIVATYVIAPPFWMAPVSLTLGVLIFYKLRAPAAGLAAIPGTSVATGSPVLMPLGLSFLAFELVHFTLERRRGRLGDMTFVDYLGCTLFFPCRVAGPIRRYPEFLQSVAAAAPTLEHVVAGLTRVLIGIAKKVGFADLLGLTVAEISYASAPLHLAKILLAYSLELYLDFSAYSDIAIGVSRMSGIVVPENFQVPYGSQNIQEFWTRWHISLSTWIRDYVFLPFGHRAFATRLRSRPNAIAALSYLVSFAVVGAWHGLTANFVVWGLYHGTLLGGHHVYRKTVAGRFARRSFYNSGIARALSVGVTFAAVTAGWILFLTPNLHEAVRLVRLMAGRP